MAIRPRIIPTLLIDEGKLVKTVKFKNANYLGDPINAIKIFNEKYVDELCVLDISSAKQGFPPNMELLQQMAEEAFMPLSYGGGINSFEQVKDIFYIGFEKVVINSALIESPQLIRKIVEVYGSQSVIASVDYKKCWRGYRCYSKGGTKRTSYDPIALCKYAEELGVGEVLLYSIDRDGTMKGFDIPMIANLSEQLSIPIIACGGAAEVEDIRCALENGKASAVAAGSMFVYFGKKKAVLINYPDEKKLFEMNIYKENS